MCRGFSAGAVDEDNSITDVVPLKTTRDLLPDGTDLDKLAYAVAWHETHDCALGSGVTHNNCFGIKPNGKFRWYATKEESYSDFKRIWRAYYGKFPTVALARKYSGNDRPQTWIKNVSEVYSR